MPRVLVIDDEPPIRLLCRVNLEAAEIEVVEAADGLSGLASAKSESPDIIILDDMMPGLDGWRLAEQLREDPVTRDIPFIFFSARIAYGDRLRAFELGAATTSRSRSTRPSSPVASGRYSDERPPNSIGCGAKGFPS